MNRPAVDADNDWVESVAARLLMSDPRLVEHEVFQLVASLAKYPEWRALPPDAAAAKVLDPPPSGNSP